MIKRSEIRWLLLIVVLAILARLFFFLIFVPYEPQLQNRDWWIHIARNIVAGEGYTTYEPTAKRGPVGVFFFAGLLYLFGDHTLPILFGQWLAEAGTCVLLYFIAREVFREQRVALVSSATYALYGPAVFFSMQALAEPIFTLMVAGFTLSFIRALRSPSVSRFIVAGVLLGLATLARPITQYYLPFALAVMVWVLRRQWNGLIKGAIAFSISFAVVMTPWIVRNYFTFGHFIFASSSSGLPLYQANYRLGEPDFLRPYMYQDANKAFVPLLLDRFGPGEGAWGTAASEYEADLAARGMATEIIRAHPVRYVGLSFMRIYRLWFHIRDGSFSRDTYVALLFNGLLILLASATFIFYRGAWLRRAVPILVFLAYYTAGHMALIAQARNSVPIAPYVILFASYTLVNVFSASLQTRQALA